MHDAKGRLLANFLPKSSTFLFLILKPNDEHFTVAATVRLGYRINDCPVRTACKHVRVIPLVYSVSLSRNRHPVCSGVISRTHRYLEIQFFWILDFPIRYNLFIYYWFLYTDPTPRANNSERSTGSQVWCLGPFSDIYLRLRSSVCNRTPSLQPKHQTTVVKYTAIYDHCLLQPGQRVCHISIWWWRGRVFF